MRRSFFSLGAKFASFSSTLSLDIRAVGTFRSSFSSTSCKAGVADTYNSLIKQGILQPDTQQEFVAEVLDSLLQQVAEYDKEMQLYYAQLKEWETQRHQLRQELLLEEAETQVKRQMEKKLAEINTSVWKSVYRWFKQVKEQVLQREAFKEKQWQQHAYGLATSDLVWERRPAKKAETGPGRMVAHIKREKRLDELSGPRPPPPPSPKGLYIYGSVGCGKTMLMDMFYNAAERAVKHRRRLHFHSALLEIHDWMHKLWKQQQQKKLENICTDGNDNDNDDSLEEQEPKPHTLKNAIKKWFDKEREFQEDFAPSNILNAVAEKLLDLTSNSANGGARLLCFDEMQVVDVFTAVTLAGIFSALMKKGVIIVSTSNRSPSDLNKEGMQKELFDKFVAELQRHCQLVMLGSEVDYRRLLAPNEKASTSLFTKNPRKLMEATQFVLISVCTLTSLVRVTGKIIFGHSIKKRINLLN